MLAFLSFEFCPVLGVLLLRENDDDRQPHEPDLVCIAEENFLPALVIYNSETFSNTPWLFPPIP